MFKQFIMVALSSVVIVACKNPVQKPFVTVDEDQINEYILASNQIEQCLYPQIASLSPSHLAAFYKTLPANEAIYLHYSSDEVLKTLIGVEKFDELQSNYQARNYFNEQFLRLNHSKPISVKEKECQKIKSEQQSFLRNNQFYFEK